MQVSDNKVIDPMNLSSPLHQQTIGFTEAMIKVSVFRVNYFNVYFLSLNVHIVIPSSIKCLFVPNYLLFIISRSRYGSLFSPMCVPPDRLGLIIHISATYNCLHMFLPAG
jgi:hypothetical protein